MLLIFSASQMSFITYWRKRPVTKNPKYRCRKHPHYCHSCVWLFLFPWCSLAPKFNQFKQLTLIWIGIIEMTIWVDNNYYNTRAYYIIKSIFPIIILGKIKTCLRTSNYLIFHPIIHSAMMPPSGIKQDPSLPRSHIFKLSHLKAIVLDLK